MAYNSKKLLTDTDKKPVPQMYDRANDVFVPLEKMEYFGKSTETKPLPSKTPIGATYMETDTAKVYMCDGTIWRLI